MEILFMLTTSPAQLTQAKTAVEGYITSFVCCYVLNMRHSQYFALIKLNRILYNCAEASFSLLLILLAF